MDWRNCDANREKHCFPDFFTQISERMYKNGTVRAYRKHRDSRIDDLTNIERAESGDRRNSKFSGTSEEVVHDKVMRTQSDLMILLSSPSSKQILCAKGQL